MRKMVLIAGMLSGIAGAAQAQSNVIIYGIVDLGLNFTNNAGGNRAYELQSGYPSGSRIGVKGKEDLGGGLSAVFQLENGFSADTGTLGQGGRLFGRQAFVGLSSNQLGTLTVGRQYDSVVDFLGPVTANGNWGGYLFSHPFDNDNTDNSFRINNAVKYTSVEYGGFKFGGMVGLGETAGAQRTNMTYSLGAQYLNGPWTVAAAYMSNTLPGASAAGSIAENDANFLAYQQRTAGAGINYTVGKATYGFVYSNTNFTNPLSSVYVGPITPASGSLKRLVFNNYELNAKYQLTPAFSLAAMYTFTQGKFNTSEANFKPKWHTLGLMADYALSKRTDVYAQAVYQQVAGSDTGSVLDRAYIPGASEVSSAARQGMLRLGLRHQF
ncbi:porin [Collimonas pratensis]|uniref:Gram-negative porin family protein n=1 Tax=Collimonas pratensis TaxID=279113 RepID=A0A127Q5A6_9BURK|nr:porin [Collimonas pratensis]AMP05214.1 gram-negative porin family protein [Collimonas pratensis]